MKSLRAFVPKPRTTTPTVHKRCLHRLLSHGQMPRGGCAGSAGVAGSVSPTSEPGDTCPEVETAGGSGRLLSTPGYRAGHPAVASGNGRKGLWSPQGQGCLGNVRLKSSHQVWPLEGIWNLEYGRG